MAEPPPPVALGLFSQGACPCMYACICVPAWVRVNLYLYVATSKLRDILRCASCCRPSRTWAIWLCRPCFSCSRASTDSCRASQRQSVKGRGPSANVSPLATAAAFSAPSLLCRADSGLPYPTSRPENPSRSPREEHSGPSQPSPTAWLLL